MDDRKIQKDQSKTSHESLDSWLKKQLYINYSRAKEEYFLTNGMFKEIGDADKLVRNPIYRNAPLMRLYLKERLENWISQNQLRVEKAMLRRIKLSKALKKAHKEKRRQLINTIESWIPECNIREITNELRDEANEFYSYRYMDYNGELTDNGLIHYIRHNYTNYEFFLSQIFDYRGQTGVQLIYPIIKKKINALIEETFNLKLTY